MTLTKTIITCILISLSGTVAMAQFIFAGLGANDVNDVVIYNDTIYAATHNGIYKKEWSTSDTSWRTVGLLEHEIINLVVLSHEEIFTAVNLDTSGDSNFCYHTANSGSSWNVVYSTEPVEREKSLYHHYIDAARGGDTLFLIDQVKNSIYRSFDRGETWDEVFSEEMTYRFIKVNPYNHEQVWFGGEGLIFNPRILESSDAGEEWRGFNFGGIFGGDNAIHDVVVPPDDMQTWYIPGEGKVGKTTDGGKNWELAFDMDPSPAGLYLYDMAISPVNSDRLYLTGIASTPPGNQAYYLYTSEDAGASWDTVMYEPDPEGTYGFYTMDVVHENNTDVVILGGNNGVFTYTKEVSTNILQNELQRPMILNIHPNPFSESTIIEVYSKSGGTGHLQILDVSGREVYHSTETLISGENQILLDVPFLISGIYFCRFSAATGKHQIKMVKY